MHATTHTGRRVGQTVNGNETESDMKVLVVGASKGTGARVVDRLLAEGHEVTAFSRSASRSAPAAARAIDGDVMDADAVARVVEGHDAVVVTLGITENPLRVRLFGPARTPLDVRSAGTANVIAAMRTHRVRRLVVQTTYGLSETRDRLDWMTRGFFALLLKPQIADTERQEALVRESGLDWTTIQPVHLDDGPDPGMPHTSTTGDTASMKVSRASVARAIARAATHDAWIGSPVAVSGAHAHAAALEDSAAPDGGVI